MENPKGANLATKEFCNKFSVRYNRSMELNNFILLKDTIKHYRGLSEYEQMYIETLSDKEKVEIILLYDTMMRSLESLPLFKDK
jgi:hypothetical protein